jgi:hypothetical protein
MTKEEIIKFINSADKGKEIMLHVEFGAEQEENNVRGK